MTQTSKHRTNKPVYVVDGSRTPFIKSKGKPGPFSAADLAVAAGRPLLDRMPFSPTEFDEVILGCVMPGPDEVNISRVVSMRLECGEKVPAYTVQRNCASGMQALDNAAQSIILGRADLVLAGGVEAMSHAPLLYNETMVNWFADLFKAKTPLTKLKTFAKLRAKHFKPVIGLLRGLTDPIVGLNMGQTAENLAYRFNISRTEMDEFALESHRRLAKAQDKDLIEEIVTNYDVQGEFYQHDTGLRRTTDMASLSTLKPVFDRKFGKITAGNSAQVTDGAAWLVLASETAVKQYNLPILGKILDSEWAGVDPAQMGLGPVHAMAPLLTRNKLALKDIDYWEINEAFAAQVLACRAAWNDETYCQEQLGLKSALGELDLNRLNVDGGGVSIGHPVGASGARIVLHLLNVLKRSQTKRGIASLCIGGGQGGAMLLESHAE